MNEKSFFELLESRMLTIARDEFSKDNLPESFDELIGSLVYYHDLHQITQTDEVISVIGELLVGKEDNAEKIRKMQKIHSKQIGLRVMIEIINSKTEDFIIKVARRFGLTSEQVVKLSNLASYYKIITGLAASEDLGFIPKSEMTNQPILTDELIRRYFRDTIENGLWSNDNNNYEAMLLPTEKIELEMETSPSVLGLFKTVFDENHYDRVEREAIESGDILLAEMAGTFALTIKIMKIPNFLENNLINIESRLKEMSKIDKRKLDAVQSPIKAMFLVFRGMLHLYFSLASVGTIQKENMELAQKYLWETGDIVPRMLALQVLWNRSKLENALRRLELQNEAFEKANELIASCLEIEETGERMLITSSTMLLVPYWKQDIGEFRESLESANAAMKITEKAISILVRDTQPTLDEIEKDLNDIDVGADQKIAATEARRAILLSRTGAQLTLDAANILIITSRAKIAEAQGLFEQAANFYELASKHDRSARSRIIEIVKFFSDILFNLPPQLSNESFISLEARALYFNGMSSINIGDQYLIQGQFKEAENAYIKAKEYFLNSNQLWKSIIPSSDKNSSDSKIVPMPSDWLITTLNRIRFVDIKISLTQAELYSDINENMKASEYFFDAHLLLRQLLIEIGTTSNDRNMKLLKANRDYCYSRYLLEKDFPGTSEENYRLGCDALFSASSSFREANEKIWENYCNAIRSEYVAYYNRRLAELPGISQPERFLQIALDRADEASKYYRQAGAETKAIQLESWVRDRISLPSKFGIIFVLRNYQDVYDMDSSALKELSKTVKMNPELFSNKEVQMLDPRFKDLLSAGAAISNYLNELEGKRGIEITEEHYQTQVIKLNTKRNKLLLELKDLVPKDGEFIELIELIRNGSMDKQVQENMIRIAEKKGWGHEFIKKIKENKDRFLDLAIQIGMKITEKSM